MNQEKTMAGPANLMLSIVVPFRNYDRSIRSVLEAVVEQVRDLVTDYEIVVVDNGSNDEEFADYQPLIGSDGLANLQVYRLIQPVDPDTAAWAGLENCLGDFMLVFDPRSDSLSCLPEAIERLQQGFEVVFFSNSIPADRGLIERVAGPTFRWLYRKMTGIDLTREATPSRLLAKRVISYLLMQPYPGMRYRWLPARAGFRSCTLTYAHQRQPDPRYGLFDRFRRALHLMVESSVFPLRLSSALAFLGASLNLVYTSYVIGVVLFKRDIAPGWATLSLQQSGMFFLISTVLFMLCEYLVQTVRWTFDGPRYYVSSESTSERLTRHQKLNVEEAGAVPADAGRG